MSFKKRINYNLKYKSIILSIYMMISLFKFIKELFTANIFFGRTQCKLIHVTAIRVRMVDNVRTTLEMSPSIAAYAQNGL